MFGSAPAQQAPPPVPEPLPSPPSYASGGSKGGSKIAGAMGKVPGWGSTLLTSPEGVDSSSTNLAKKSLLGQ